MSRRQDPAVRPDRAASAAAVARQPLGVAARLVAGQIGDRATPGGRVQVAPADLPACGSPLSPMRWPTWPAAVCWAVTARPWC